MLKSTEWICRKCGNLEDWNWSMICSTCNFDNHLDEFARIQIVEQVKIIEHNYFCSAIYNPAIQVALKNLNKILGKEWQCPTCGYKWNWHVEKCLMCEAIEGKKRSEEKDMKDVKDVKGNIKNIDIGDVVYWSTYDRVRYGKVFHFNTKFFNTKQDDDFKKTLVKIKEFSTDVEWQFPIESILFSIPKKWLESQPMHYDDLQERIAGILQVQLAKGKIKEVALNSKDRSGNKMTHVKQEILDLCKEIGSNLRSLIQLNTYFQDVEIELNNKSFTIGELDDDYEQKLTELSLWVEQVGIKVKSIAEKVESMREEIPR